MVALAAMLTVGGVATARSESVWVVVPDEMTPRLEFGVSLLTNALAGAGSSCSVVKDAAGDLPARRIVVGWESELPAEGFRLKTDPVGAIHLAGGDNSGVLYGCVELAGRIRAAAGLPKSIDFSDRPAMTLRGACVGMQKTYILPGRKVYEYPYTPDLFPWFYDKSMWTEYLDTLVENRMNTLYLWNGHPFASLVRLQDYPDAVEVSAEVFQQNVEMFRWLTAECDRRGIWLVQMFYNIFLPKPLADSHGIETQLSAPTPLASDYTRKSIAEFVKQYPHVGLLVCLGEALQGTENQINWATNTILPGVLDGMKAAGLKEQPPVVIRTHAMNPEAIMPACFQVYSNLFTMTKYNGESLTTYEPRGRVQQTHLNMARLGPHIVNVHILSNLEPFRYGATEFIRKSIIASRDRYGASGLHLYPLAYWNWPYAPDLTATPLKQWDRDWMWFEAWGRYAWNPDVLKMRDGEYWCGRLSKHYGCSDEIAAKILDAVNDAGEVAPMLVRRFGITEGNRQTLSLGMTLDQLVNPNRYNAIKDLWECMAPPGERLDEYVRKEWTGEPHAGETPSSVVSDCLRYSSNAVALLAASEPHVRRNQAEFRRLLNDARCTHEMARSYAAKVMAAARVLHYAYSKDIRDLAAAEAALASSLDAFNSLTRLTGTSYRFANSMQTGHRKIPFPGAAGGVGTNYLWNQVLPLYERELADFHVQLQRLRQPRPVGSDAEVAAWPAAPFTLISTNAETYTVKVGARPFSDRKYVITALAPELSGLTGIRFRHEEAKNGRYVPVEFEVSEPVRVLIGYFQSDRDLWLQVPNLDVASHADERGGVEPVIRNAAHIEECPDVNVHAFRYGPGRHRLELIGKGSFVVLGIVPQSAELKPRDAGSLGP